MTPKPFSYCLGLPQFRVLAVFTKSSLFQGIGNYLSFCIVLGGIQSHCLLWLPCGLNLNDHLLQTYFLQYSLLYPFKVELQPLRNIQILITLDGWVHGSYNLLWPLFFILLLVHLSLKFWRSHLGGGGLDRSSFSCSPCFFDSIF